jgi:hypothetical protein
MNKDSAKWLSGCQDDFSSSILPTLDFHHTINGKFQLRSNGSRQPNNSSSEMLQLSTEAHCASLQFTSHFEKLKVGRRTATGKYM